MIGKDLQFFYLFKFLGFLYVEWHAFIVLQILYRTFYSVTYVLLSMEAIINFKWKPEKNIFFSVMKDLRVWGMALPAHIKKTMQPPNLVQPTVLMLLVITAEVMDY